MDFSEVCGTSDRKGDAVAQGGGSDDDYNDDYNDGGDQIAELMSGDNGWKVGVGVGVVLFLGCCVYCCLNCDAADGDSTDTSTIAADSDSTDTDSKTDELAVAAKEPITITNPLAKTDELAVAAREPVSQTI